jgi:hypothetical protein
MDRWNWITPDGVVVPLDEDPIYLNPEISGHLMPPFKRSERWLGSIGKLTGLRVDARDVFLPLMVKANNLTDALRLMARYFNPQAGVGKLRVTTDSGTRELICQYVGGLDGDGRDNGPGWQKVGLRLRALQPYWQADIAKNFVFTIVAPVIFFQSPFFPLRISHGTIDGTVTVSNDGDVPTYPIITASGAFMSLQVDNLDTGKTLSFPTLSMVDGDNLVIDSRPDVLSVKLNGNNAFGMLSAASSLWSIKPGENHLKIVTTGTNSNSVVTISFTEQFLTV